MQILPRRAPGYDVGSAAGTGIGQGLEMLSNRYMQQNALSALDELSRQQPGEPPLDAYGLLKGLLRATAGIPGGGQIVETVYPQMLQQLRAQAVQPGAGAPSSVSAAPSISAMEGVSTVQRREGPTGTLNEVGEQAVQPQVAADMPVESLSMTPEEQQEIKQAYKDLSAVSRQMLSPSLARLPEAAAKKIGAWNIPSEQQYMQNISNSMRSAGMSFPEAKAIEDARLDRSRNEYLSQIERYEKATQLEDKQQQFFSGRIDEIMQQAGYPEDRFIKDHALDLVYEEILENRPGDTDQKIAKRMREKLLNQLDVEKAVTKVGVPLMYPFGKDADKTEAAAKGWVKDYLSAFGDSPRARSRAQTLLEDQGWDKITAHEYSHPFSKDLDRQLEKIPMLSSYGVGADILLSKKYQNKQKMIRASAPFIAKKVSPNDSLLSIRNYFADEKNLPVVEADALVEDIAKRMPALTDSQKAELAEVRGSSTWRGLTDIFFFPKRAVRQKRKRTERQIKEALEERDRQIATGRRGEG